MLHVSYAYVVCNINTNVYDIREIIKYAGACTLNNLEIKFEYVMNTLQYGGICCHTAKGSQNFVHAYVLLIR